VGNSGSIKNMIRRAGGESVISSGKDDIESANGYILPGVGAFDHGMSKLNNSGLLDILKTQVMNNKKPILGICLGMQMLLNRSDEGELPGLGWLDGEVKKFTFKNNNENKKLKIPHMGWNIVRPRIKQTLFKGFEEESRFYFVHSYYVSCNKEENILGTTQYGHEFVSSVRKDNIYGVQFHPEKSHRFGMNLFKNFLEICKCYEQE
jgi:glutamine amidotransferase